MRNEKSRPQMPKSGSEQNTTNLVDGWVSSSRYKKTEMKRAKRYAHCHLAHSIRCDGRKRNIIWKGANVTICCSTSESEKRYAHCHFRHSSLLNKHFGALDVTKNQSLVNIDMHTSKQNNKNNWAKHVKICTCKKTWKIDNRKLIKKNVMSKMNENPATKMQVMLPTMCCKRKLLKYNCFLKYFWSL